MNLISIIIISFLIGIIIFSSVQNFLFYFSKEIEKKIEEEKVKNFIELIKKISKISTEYFYTQYFLGLSNLIVKDNIIKINIENRNYSFFLDFNVEETEIYKASKYCILKDFEKIKIFNCDYPINISNNFCEIEECKLESKECKGPNPICIGDGYCNRFIGENCRNSIDCIEDSKEKVCCPEDPNSDEKGYTIRKNRGEECFCDNQCSGNLKCNPVASGFKKYNKACCEEGKYWNGSECIDEEKECKYPCSLECNKLPEKWDWRNVNGKNYLNPVRDQGTCGSCWAFTTIGTVESVYNIEKNCPACNKDLSEQQLVSNNQPCCSYCGSCDGGYLHKALEYVKSVGVVDENCCPYVAYSHGSQLPYMWCNICNEYSKKVWKIKEFSFIPNDINKIKKALICYGPLAVGSDAWKHAIVLIGYDENSEICKQKYGKSKCWIIRNSWGLIDGFVYGVYHEKGYGYIPYDGHPFSDLINMVFYVKSVVPP